jgi:hypothetical protein
VLPLLGPALSRLVTAHLRSLLVSIEVCQRDRSSDSDV